MRNETEMSGYKRSIVLAVITIPLCIIALALLIMEKKKTETVQLDVPQMSEVTVCYYIPDLSKPYEQTWYGGDELENILDELADMKFIESDEAPSEGTFRVALVIATNEEQITVQFDETERAWVFYEGRWLHEKD